jgi:hypothetical protein
VTFRPRALPFALVAAAGLFACGGSSSETPPPLEPLPVNLHYDRASTALAGEVPAVESDAGVATLRASDPLPEDDQASPPARSTWGTERSPAPSPLK